jgi:hypothetical protein
MLGAARSTASPSILLPTLTGMAQRQARGAHNSEVTRSKRVAGNLMIARIAIIKQSHNIRQKNPMLGGGASHGGRMPHFESPAAARWGGW